MGKHVSEKELQKSFHLSGSNKGGAKGCVTKCYTGKVFDDDHHANYRYHGYDETKKKPTKSGRYKPSPARLASHPLTRELQHGFKTPTKLMPRNPLTDPAGWGFNKTPNARGHINYQNANVPFAHQYHHMIPWEVLGGGTFTSAELKLLQKSEYCMHDGFNLIILPMRNRVAEILRMHTHPNNHVDYNLELQIQVHQVKSALCGGDPNLHLDANTAPVMKDTLENWEKREWQKIMDSGEQKFPAHVNEHMPSDMTPALMKAIS